MVEGISQKLKELFSADKIKIRKVQRDVCEGDKIQMAKGFANIEEEDME